MKYIAYAALAVALSIGGFFALNAYIYEEKQAHAGKNPANAEYIIGGTRVQLVDGVSEIQFAPESAEKTITMYFGNEVHTDLNEDGRDDAVFILTQTIGGSGTFYYAAAALNTDRGYIGSEALLLGDRIAPQTTEVSQNPSHKGVVIVNYADRRPEEPMSAEPTIAKSIWLKLDPQSMQFGEVMQHFEGEADPDVMTLTMKPWKWVSTTLRDGTKVMPKLAGEFGVTFDEIGRFSVDTDCNTMGGEYTTEDDSITMSDMISTMMYCEGSMEGEFAAYLNDAEEYQFTTRGELIILMKEGKGTVLLK